MFVFSNLATTLDGKIAPAQRDFYLLGTPEDHKQMHVLRRESDAILIGASTLRTFRRPLLAKDAKSQPMNIVVSSRLEGISPSWPFFKKEGVKRILFVGPQAKASRIKKFEKFSEVIRLKKPTSKTPTAVQIIRALKPLGIKRLLVEGGGGIMWDFVSQNLIDEYHVTLTPKLIGGTESPTLVDGLGLKSKHTVNLKLAQARVLGDEIFLIYRRTDKRG